MICGSCKASGVDLAHVKACFGATQPAPAWTGGPAPAPKATSGKLATDKQVAFITKLLKQLNTTPEAAGFAGVAGMDRKDASNLIDTLMTKVNEAKASYDLHVEHGTAPKQTKIVTSGKDPKPGTYTLVRPDGSYRTFQFAHAKWADGKLVASYLSGADNEVAYTGFAFIFDGQPKLWKKFKDDGQLAADLNTFLGLDSHDDAHNLFLDQAEAYALASGNCMRCGKKLTVPASLHRGLGPVCANIEGV